MSAREFQVFLQTFGCQMNEHDSQQMNFVLTRAGYSFTSDIQKAGVIILNTCSVREGPENKLHSYLGRLKAWKNQDSRLIIGVGGCVARQEKDKLFQRSPWVDIVFGPDNYLSLPQMIEEARTGKKVLRVEWRRRNYEKLNPLNHTSSDEFKPRINAGKAYIAITQGCNNFCSFCIVPFTRGREISRSLDDILREAQNLILAGAKEITLVGQNVNSYKTPQAGFYDLLKEVSQLTGLRRLKFISPHPKDWNYKLSKLMATTPNICNQLHLPFQSGSTRILQLMRRDHDIASYRKKIAAIKKLIPDISLTTDVIVGFPSETEDDFGNTLALLQEIGFLQVYAFKYSPRPGTKAERMLDDVPLAIKEKRLAEIINWQAQSVAAKLRTHIGKTTEVLIDQVKKGAADDFQSSGKTEGNITVKIPKTEFVLGQILPVKIIDSGRTSLIGAVETVS